MYYDMFGTRHTTIGFRLRSGGINAANSSEFAPFSNYLYITSRVISLTRFDLPASLPHVNGFPVLGVLQRLRDPIALARQAIPCSVRVKHI